MNIEYAIKILRDHNDWRRGGDGEATDPKELGEAIDTVCDHVDEFRRFIDEVFGDWEYE